MTRFESIQEARRKLRPKRRRLAIPLRAWLDRLPRRKRRPQRSASREMGIGMGLWGSNLTYFHAADGTSLSLHGPPVPLHADKRRPRTYMGRDLTRHVDTRNALTFS